MNVRDPPVVNEGIVGRDGKDRSHLVCATFAFFLLWFHQVHNESALDFKGDFHGTLSPARLDRLLGDVQTVLWKSRYLIKDYVTERGAAVKELHPQSEGPWWGKEPEDIQLRSALVVACGGCRRTRSHARRVPTRPMRIH